MKNQISDALGLLARCRESDPFRAYLQERQVLVLGAGIVMLLVALACATGIATFLASLRTWLTLPALLLGSLVLAASGAVQLYVFFSWLEGRALAGALHKPVYTRYGIPLGPMPAVQWPLVAALILVPLLLLAISAPITALLIIVLAAGTPVAFAHFESQLPRHPAPEDAET